MMNRVAEVLTEWNLESAIGKPVGEVMRIVSGSDRRHNIDIVQQAIAGGSIVELPKGSILLTREGGERIVADSASPIKDSSGAIVGAVVVFRDITERQRLEEDLFKSKKLESVGVLAGGIAHDFNNILTAVSTNLFLIKLGVPHDSEPYRLVNDTIEAAMRASRLTKQLLTFAKGGEPVKEISSVKRLIEDSIGFLLSGSNVDYVLKIDEDLFPVEMDRGQIDQVLANLIINAEQAMKSGGTITVKCRNAAVDVEGIIGEQSTVLTSRLKPGFYVEILIEDEGAGSPEMCSIGFLIRISRQKRMASV